MNAPTPAQAFRPWETPEQNAARDRLFKCQRIAASRATNTASDGARTIFWLACDLASRRASANASVERMMSDRDCLVRLFMAANAIESLESEQ